MSNKQNNETKSDKTADYKHLGFANGWQTDPDEIADCKAKEKRNKKNRKAENKNKGRHTIEVSSIGNGIRQYVCHACKYKYCVDSTG